MRSFRAFAVLLFLNFLPLLVVAEIPERFAGSDRGVDNRAVAMTGEPVMSPTMRTGFAPVKSVTQGVLYFQSGFEEDWTYGAPPGWMSSTPNSDSCWHRNDYTLGWSNANGYTTAYAWSFMGGYSARFHVAGTPAGRGGFMITPNIDLSSATDSIFVSFWWANGPASPFNVSSDRLLVSVSSDGGATFSQLGFVGSSGNPWLRAIAYLPTRSATTRIKFQAISDGGSSNDFLLDEVLVFQRGSAYSNDLTLPGDFSSFTDAARRLSVYGVVGPTLITVAPGVYADSVTFPPITGASADNVIAFLASNGPVTVQRSGVPTASTSTPGATVQRTDDAVMNLWGADYMYFDGIGISNTAGSTQTEYGYHLRALLPNNGATNNTILNCKIVLDKSNLNTFGILQETFWALNNQSGANNYNSYFNDTIRSCGLRAIALDGYPGYLDLGCEIASADNGTFHISNVGGPNVSPAAVQISAQRGVKVHGLVIDSLDVVSTSLPVIFIGGSSSLADSVMDFEVYSNQIQHVVNTATDVNGVLSAVRVAFSSTSLAAAFTGKVYNNMVCDFEANGARPDGIIAFYHQATAWSQVEWYCNTVLLDCQTFGPGGGSVVLRVNSGTAIVRNNVFVNNSALGRTGSNYIYTKTGGTLIASYNDLFVDTSFANMFIGIDGLSNYRRLQEWQSSATGRDSQSVYEFPHFVNNSDLPYDLHINPVFSTRLESGGVSLPGITKDLDGDPRYPNPGYPQNPLFPPGAPDLGADEFAGMPFDSVAPSIAYTPLPNTRSTLNPSLTGVSIADNRGINTSSGNKPRIYFRKSNNNNGYLGNTSSSNGWKYAEAPGTSAPFDFVINYAILYPNGAVAVGDTIEYFVVAQDIASPANVAVNSGVFNVRPFTVALASAAFPVTGVIKRYIITSNALSGTYNVGAGQSFASLTGNGGLFSALGGAVVTGNVTAIITSDLAEPGTYSLTRMSPEGASAFTLSILPSGGVRTVAGDINAALIDLNGAAHVTIDGNLGGVKCLKFRNSSSGVNATTLTLRGDAQNNTITNCIIEGAGTGDSAGTILFGLGTTGNSGNTISGCDIRDRSDAPGVPSNAVSSIFPLNGSNAFLDNRIFNWTKNGIRVPPSGAGDRWKVSSSSFYQTALRSTPMRAIAFESGKGHSFAGNSIGGSAPDRGGVPLTTSFGTGDLAAFEAIVLSVGTESSTVVFQNSIGNISCTGNVGLGFSGVRVSSGNVALTNNTVGGGGTVWDTVWAAGRITGVLALSGSGNVLATGNTIGSIRTGDSLLCGISSSGTGYCVISNNIISNLSTSSTASPLRGITNTNPNTLIEKNTVFNLNNSSTGTSPQISVAGIFTSGDLIPGVTTVIRKNRIHALTAAGTGLGLNAPRIWGIAVAGNAPASVSNNMVATGTGQGGDARLVGIESAGSGGSGWYYNSVSIAGLHTVSGTNGSQAFLRSGTGTDTLRDNIFSNTRTRGARAHVAIENSNGINWNPATSDRNLLYSGNQDSIGRWLTNAYSLAGWRTVTGGDPNSAAGDPLFVGTTDLHIRTDALSPANNIGTPIAGITDDIDGDLRDPSTPDAGADEFKPPVGVDELPSGIPLVFGLDQNFPNPFNPTTAIRYALPKDSRVSLRVYNILGQKLATLVDAEQTAGYHVTTWNGRTLSGHDVASGVYFYQLRAEPRDGSASYVQVRRMLVVK